MRTSAACARFLHGSDEHATPLLFKIEDARRERNVLSPLCASTIYKRALHALQPHVVDVGVLLQLLPLERVPGRIEIDRRTEEGKPLCVPTAPKMIFPAPESLGAVLVRDRRAYNLRQRWACYAATEANTRGSDFTCCSSGSKSASLGAIIMSSISTLFPPTTLAMQSKFRALETVRQDRLLRPVLPG